MNIKVFCCGSVNPLGVIEPVFSWKINNCNDKKQTAYNITVLTTNKKVVWDSGIVYTDDSVNIKYKGCKLKDNTKYLWQVTVFTENFQIKNKFAYFITGMINNTKVQWISPDKRINSPFVYKSFQIESISEYSVVNVCGLGFFELYINDKKVSDDLMNPVRTDYDSVKYTGLKYPFDNITNKSVQYLTYEVSKYLKCGQNTVCIWLGNGWYRQKSRTVEGIFDYGERLKMFFRLTNGNDIVESGDDWLCAASPIIYDNIFYGEIYDSRIKLFDFDNSMPVYLCSYTNGKIVSQMCPSEKEVAKYTPLSLSKNLYDSKICISGFAEICCCGNSGDEVEIYYAEELDKNNNLDFTSTVGYVESDKNQIQKDVFILNGEHIETYKPRFVWHAFRYFKISAPESVKIKAVSVNYVCTALKYRASFKCSNDVLNKFHKISLNSGLSNLHGSVPMDCPHRERLGYTGDGSISALSMMYNFNAYHLYDKWLTDIIDAQNKKTGYVPHTAPFSGGGGGPAWGSAIAVVPWNMYMQYGNKEILIKAEKAIKKWIKYLSGKTENGLVTHEESGSWCLGDWCMPSRFPWSEPHFDEIKLPPELVNTCYYIYCIDIYCRLLNVLDKKPSNWLLEKRKNSINAINKRYLHTEYASGEQGCNIFPLFIDIVPKTYEKDVLRHTINRIENKKFCFETGLLGTKFLFSVLDKYERNDIAIKILLNCKYPSFGHMLNGGATALWETWEGNGSKNHTAFLSTDSWLFYGLAGIKPNGGYKEFCIKPYFAEELDFLDVSIECEYGEIMLKWERKKTVICVQINIPFNTTAHVNLSGKKLDLQAGNYEYLINQ